MLFEQITIVGVGLIGGSIGLAAKARGIARCVVGAGRDPAKLAKAERLGAIDRGTPRLEEAVENADLVAVCTPVDLIASTILRAAPHCKPGTLFTDGGSTKATIVKDVTSQALERIAFVPAHPIAGSEKNGVEYARADLFEDRLTILTPIASGDPALESVAAFWKALGSRIAIMSPADHDKALASTSHLPHAVASAVAGITPRDWLPLSAGGFRDVTRIAAGDPHLWTPIFLENREAVLAALDRFTHRLDEFQQLVDSGNAAGLARWLADGKQVRDALGT
ncbi:MAG TPA: prephenate dehydrogenase/arogenate dehydrogenase family protein [Urbifossiella sp.]|nr:prephenate dehydrogenase/arogenate dehydrogenase family protein [Urbifossiella sp.]